MASGHYEAYVNLGGQRASKRFGPQTHLSLMRTWREQARRRLSKNVPLEPAQGLLRRSLTGWCYIYFIQDGDAVKIGRAVDPNRRLDELQTAHKGELSLVAAVPAHASLEGAFHEKFAALQIGREWFTLSKSLVDFINELKTGVNPIALLWAEKPSMSSHTA